MIEEPRQFELPDMSGRGNNIILAVNWSKDSKVKNCRAIRIKMGKQESIIDKEHLNSMLFIFGNEEEQRKLLPQKVLKTKHIKKVVEVTAKKDIKKGEKIVFPISFTMPSEEEAILKSYKLR